MARCPVCYLEPRRGCADCVAVRELTDRLRTAGATARASAALTVMWILAILAPLDAAVFVFVVGLVAPASFVVSMRRRVELRRELAVANGLVPQLPAARVVKS